MVCRISLSYNWYRKISFSQKNMCHVPCAVRRALLPTGNVLCLLCLRVPSSVMGVRCALCSVPCEVCIDVVIPRAANSEAFFKKIVCREVSVSSSSC